MLRRPLFTEKHIFKKGLFPDERFPLRLHGLRFFQFGSDPFGVLFRTIKFIKQINQDGQQKKLDSHHIHDADDEKDNPRPKEKFSQKTVFLFAPKIKKSACHKKGEYNPAVKKDNFNKQQHNRQQNGEIHIIVFFIKNHCSSSSLLAAVFSIKKPCSRRPNVRRKSAVVIMNGIPLDLFHLPCEAGADGCAIFRISLFCSYSNL